MLVSAQDEGLADLLVAHAASAFGGRVVGVVADRGETRAIDAARGAGVPVAVVAQHDFPDRAAWRTALAGAVAVFSPDVVVLAGFVTPVGQPLLDRFEGRVVADHSSAHGTVIVVDEPRRLVGVVGEMVRGDRAGGGESRRPGAPATGPVARRSSR
ncbi:formyltransferase family protein [Cellulomonas sp. JH27-2]|uniref:formyltransferase family protein n=1 Tax=Cellulomonas sp. JH27-2 TaxID=2774139 RepID=UPI00351B0F68